MCGLIRAKHLFTHGHIIIGHFGVKCYISCCIMVIRGVDFTFLDIAWKYSEENES